MKQENWAGILQMFMKHAFDRDILPLIKALKGIFEAIEQEGGGDYIKEAFTYLFNTGEARSPEAFIQTVKGYLSAETEETIMTLAQQFEARGIEKGRAEALEKQKIIALKLRQQGMVAEQVAQITKLPLTTIKELYAANNH